MKKSRYFVDFLPILAYNNGEVKCMAPEGYELIKYTIHGQETWVLKDNEENYWFPLSEIFKSVFKMPMNVAKLRQKQLKHTMRVRMTTPRKALKQLSAEEQPKDVIVFGDLWCIKNLIRTRLRLNQEAKYKGRDILVEELCNYWGFSAIGFGVLTQRKPNIQSYPLIEQIAIVAEINHQYWLKCAECERYYPHTDNFYRTNNITCEKCLGREFKIRSTGAYGRIAELLKKRGRD